MLVARFAIVAVLVFVLVLAANAFSFAVECNGYFFEVFEKLYDFAVFVLLICEEFIFPRLIGYSAYEDEEVGVCRQAHVFSASRKTVQVATGILQKNYIEAIGVFANDFIYPIVYRENRSDYRRF